MAQQFFITYIPKFIPEAPQGPKPEEIFTFRGGVYFEMVCKVYFRRFVALLLCCVLVGSSFARSVFASDPVTAASLAISGGQLAGAGLSGEAALSLAGPVGAVVGVTLGALGVNAYVSKAAQEAGKTRTRFVLDKLVIWGAQAGYTQEQLYSKIAQGISVAADGTIKLGNDVAKMIDQFGSWLFTQAGQVVPSIPSGGNDATIGLGSMSLPLLTSLQLGDYITGSDANQYSFSFNDSIAFIILYESNRYFPYFICDKPTSFTRTYNSSVINGVINNSYNGYYYASANLGFWYSSVSVDQSIVYRGNGIVSFLATLDGSWNPDAGSTAVDEVFTGSPESWAENKDVLNPAGDSPVTLNPDLINPIIDSLADGQQATMSIIDYLQALQDAWDHALDDVQTAIGTITDQLTGIQEQIAVPQDAVKNPSITNPGVTPDTTPILDPSTVDPATAVTGLSFDLTQIFPFCIPFDIYSMLATLSATPQAPVYHVHYEGPYNILIDFTVDLSSWDSVAAVLRTVELLAFCIGLAYVTRSMFIRS